MPSPSDLEIARSVPMQPISEIAERLAIPADALVPYGRHKAKVALDFLESIQNRPDGKLILVTAMTPTPAGEGKTTTTVGLGDALNRIGLPTAICLREPSLGPCFGMKGGAAGGGRAQVVPMEDINLHFTGDFHAIGVAHNLLASMLDNHIYWGNSLGIDARRVAWRRVVDMNDRALRRIVSSLGGVANGFPREDGFDITVASEVMAIFCLVRNLAELGERLGDIVVAQSLAREPIRARDLNAAGAMSVLLRDALMPNLVQTLEHNPAFIHGGPFANIAHGCNSLISTTTALKLADYVVTEAGFGADLGAEKFFDIKCRRAGLKPAAAVVVATVRALKMHAGIASQDLGAENPKAVRDGAANLVRHIQNVKKFGVPPIVAVNRFTSDTDAELAVVAEIAAELGTKAVVADHWASGGAGAEDLAREVAALTQAPSQFAPLYADDEPLFRKIATIATEIYHASEVTADSRVRNQLKAWDAAGYSRLPVCIAKTQYSFSTDPALKGAPSNHSMNVRDVRLSAGAGFVIAIAGDIMTMPGLPRTPAAEAIGLDAEGRVDGLF
jgi:formate--tetrahydrofolate ligase